MHSDPSSWRVSSQMIHRGICILAVLALLTSPVLAQKQTLALDALYDAVAIDIARGKPLIVHVHVPLCESSIIVCGNAKLGDGQ